MQTKCRFLFLIFVFVLTTHRFCYGQDSFYARQVIKDLCSEKMHGRGYVKKGDQNASIYISKEFQFAGLEKLSKGYYQEFTHSVNTFPSSMYVKLDTAVLQAGVQFIVDPKSPSAKGSYLIEETNALPDQYSERALRYRFVYVNPKGLSSEDSLKLMAAWKEDKRAAGYIFRHKKLTWSVGTEVMEKPMIYLLNDSVAKSFKHIELSIKNKFISRYKSRNVVAYVKGKVKPDSMIVVSAHYDHLGRMGKTALFPGANDNASGVALMLNLVKHYALTENKPDYSILFIAFAAEEAGLKGSLHYTQNPLKPLSKIKFLINLDLTGTGDEGITVVNATEFPEHFDRIKKINEEENYFTYVGSRGKAKNSDHYYFSEAGVPSFFIYTMGGIKAYHDIYDIPETLPLTRYRQLFRLIDDFIKGIH